MILSRVNPSCVMASRVHFIDFLQLVPKGFSLLHCYRLYCNYIVLGLIQHRTSPINIDTKHMFLLLFFIWLCDISSCKYGTGRSNTGKLFKKSHPPYPIENFMLHQYNKYFALQHLKFSLFCYILILRVWLTTTQFIKSISLHVPLVTTYPTISYRRHVRSLTFAYF